MTDDGDSTEDQNELGTMATIDQRTLPSGEPVHDPATIVLVLVRGESLTDTPIYAYVGLMEHRVPAFMDAQASGTLYPEDFGVVVASGEGEPPEELRLKMEFEYGFRHETVH